MTYDFSDFLTRGAFPRQVPPIRPVKGRSNEFELPIELTFNGSAAAKKEKWLVTLQLGVRQLTIEYHLGLEGTVHYLLGVSFDEIVSLVETLILLCLVMLWIRYLWLRRDDHVHAD